VADRLNLAARPEQLPDRPGAQAEDERVVHGHEELFQFIDRERANFFVLDW